MKMTHTQLAIFWARRSSAALLVLLLFARPAIVLAETPLPDAPMPPPPPQALQITILDGEGALNNIRQRTAREPIVQVQDENHKPVAGVLILFTIHSGSGGAGATFNGLSTLSVTTDSAGRAVAHGFLPNTGSGSFTITVQATLGTLSATATIHQGNGGGGSSSAANAGHAHSVLKWSLIGAAAAAAAVLVIVLTQNNSTQITAGAGSVAQ